MGTTESKLGRLCNALSGRDAIHIAIAPVVAKVEMRPGDHAGVDGTQENPVGIVDPFLDATVEPGETFYLCLYPNTITSLRHVWEHPKFEADSTRNISDAEAYVAKIADICGMNSTRLMLAALEWVEYNDYSHMGTNEDYRGVTGEQWDRFWKCFEELTGVDASKRDGDDFFSCSC